MKFKKGDYVKIVKHYDYVYLKNQIGNIGIIKEIVHNHEYPYTVLYITGEASGSVEIYDNRGLKKLSKEEAMVELL